MQLHAIDSVSVGWGVVARVEPGSGFDFVRKKVAGAWVASVLTIEASGRTLLFRKFHIKSVTAYSGHQPFTAPASSFPDGGHDVAHWNFAVTTRLLHDRLRQLRTTRLPVVRKSA